MLHVCLSVLGFFSDTDHSNRLTPFLHVFPCLWHTQMSGEEVRHSLLSRSLSREPVGTHRCMLSSLLPFQLLLIQGTPSLAHATWALSPEDLAYASRASPGLWIDCLLKMHAKETLPSAGIWSKVMGCRGSSIRTDYVVLVCHFRLMANKIYFWLRIPAS